MRVIAIANHKGGCGKTTTSINLSGALALLQKKTLLIDLDPQGHSTCGLGFDVRKLRYTVYDLLTPHHDSSTDFFKTRIAVNPNLDLLPSYEILNALEEELASQENKWGRLKQLLQPIQQLEDAYDYVILDCPPNLGVLTLNALEASDEVIIPVEPSFFSLHGLAKISETIQLQDQKRHQPLEIHALLTLFDSRVKFAQEIYEEVKKTFWTSFV